MFAWSAGLHAVILSATLLTEPYETVVTAGSEHSAASSFVIDSQEFLLRAHRRTADMLSATPGLYVVQHAGGGKANQYFLRGFDSDHGTDLAITVEGVPVNFVSHGHGQGYTDIHWLIPEVVKEIDVHKGPYQANQGDFATAGSVDMTFRDHTPTNSVTFTTGAFNTWRGLALINPSIENTRTFIAGETFSTNGPFIHGEHLLRQNLFTKITHPLSNHETLTLTLTGYLAAWNASGQIPERAVTDGSLNRFDSIEQNDARTQGGIVGHYRSSHTWLGKRFASTFGLQLRHDEIRNALYQAPERARLATMVDASIAEGSLGFYAQEEVHIISSLRTIFGVRSDLYNFAVSDLLQPSTPAGAQSSGVKQSHLMSPKLSVIWSPHAHADFFTNAGYGFHSNDARGAVRAIDRVTPLTRAFGTEVGAKAFLFHRLHLRLAVFALHLNSETVWVGDAGTTEPRGRSRRQGIEFTGWYRISPWLYADVDMSLSRAIFIDSPQDANAIPLAPLRIVSTGLTAQHPKGYYGRLGIFHLGPRPATEDRFLVAQGFTRADATVGFHHPRFDIRISAENMLNTSWREDQFANVSRLSTETSASSCPQGTRPTEEGRQFLGCEDMHFTPGAPVNIMASGTLYF